MYPKAPAVVLEIIRIKSPIDSALTAAAQDTEVPVLSLKPCTHPVQSLRAPRSMNYKSQTLDVFPA